MKKFITLLFAVVLAFAVLPIANTQAAELADGKYSLPYQVNKTGSTSASIANDYFIKPATLVKKDGVMYVQLTLKNSAQFVKFEAPSGGNKVVSKDAANDRRTVQFNVSSLTSAQKVNVRIEIPEEDYYHNYSIDFIWYSDKAKLIESYAKAEEKPAATTTKPAESKPAVTETKKTETVKTTETKKEEPKVEDKKEDATKEEDKKDSEDAIKEEDKKAEEAVEEESTEELEAAVLSTEEENTTEGEAVATAATVDEAATANDVTEDSSSSNTTGWVIGIIAVLLVVAGGFLFLRKSKTA